MSKFKQIFNMKTAHGFLRIAIAGMLVFSMLIPTAVSYQQAISSSNENVYSIGDGINVSLRVRQGESDTLYPTDEVDFEPIVTNNGNQAAWIVVAVKIPSMNQPFTPRGTGSLAHTINYHEWKSENLYYPAFYVAYDEDIDDLFYYQESFWSTAIGLGYLDGVAAFQMQFGDNSPLEYIQYASSEEIRNQMQQALDNCNEMVGENWWYLDVNTDYAYQENGFYIYYYGYEIPISSGESVSPLKKIVSANFQDKVTVAIDGGEDKLKYDSDGNPIIDETKAGYYLNAIEKDIDCQYRNCNIGVEAKAYAIQASYAENGNAESNITDIWNENKSKFPAFGSETVVNVVTSTSYATGEHDVEFVITKDAQSLQIKNATTGKVVTVSDTQSAVDTGTDFKTITVPVDFQTSGVYQVSASSKASAVKDNYVNAVDMGYIEVTSD